VEESWEEATERSRQRRAVSARQARSRRRRSVAILAGGIAAVVAVGLVLLGSGGGNDDRPTTAEARPKPKLATLPGGGRTIFPGRRVVALYGTTGTPVLGDLGRGSAAQASRRVLRVAEAYRHATALEVLPAFELIATVASRAPGDDGLYRTRRPIRDLRRYHRAIRSVGGLLVIDVQPGRGDFLTEVRPYRKLLEEPDVSLALDPEWKMGPGEVPGQVIGHTDAMTVNAISFWLSRIVERRRLPQKLLVVHQFTEDMIRDRARVKPRSGLAVTFNVDGLGGRAVKLSKYRALAPRRKPFHAGFKLFYTEDVDRFHPRDVLRFRPKVLFVDYQ
jgi:hypothetical protein